MLMWDQIWLRESERRHLTPLENVASTKYFNDKQSLTFGATNTTMMCIKHNVVCFSLFQLNMMTDWLDMVEVWEWWFILGRERGRGGGWKTETDVGATSGWYRGHYWHTVTSQSDSDGSLTQSVSNSQLHFVTQLQLRKEKLINRKVYSILPGEAGEISFLALRMSGAIMVFL